MGNTPLTPANDTDLTSPAVDSSPDTVPYNEAFENDLMDLILHPPTAPTQPTSSLDTQIIAANQLPIPITSHLRTYPSPIPGLYVTQPNGYHTGGPGPSSHTVNKFAERFIREHDVDDAGQLERVVEALVKRKIEEARERMVARSDAVEKNRAIDRELEDLRLQRSAELRVMERVKGGKR